LLAAFGTLFFAACGGGVQTAALPPSNLLASSVIVPLSYVIQYFPQVTVQASTGQDATAVGNPIATRATIYASSDLSHKVTITVDQYSSTGNASLAYQQAVASSVIPGFAPVTVPNLGQETFAGTVTMGTETHVGIGVLVGNLVVGATLAGFAGTNTDIANLVTVTRTEVATVQALSN
jgi:hypothetical protein